LNGEFFDVNSKSFKVSGGSDWTGFDMYIPSGAVLVPYITAYAANEDDDYGFHVGTQPHPEKLNWRRITIQTHFGNGGSYVAGGVAVITPRKQGSIASSKTTRSFSGSVEVAEIPLCTGHSETLFFQSMFAYKPRTEDWYAVSSETQERSSGQCKERVFCREGESSFCIVGTVRSSGGDDDSYTDVVTVILQR
jgi:hypothetical protein